VPPESTVDVILSGVPEATGTLVVRGCIVRTPGGTSKEFILPLFTDQEEDRLMKKRQSLACEFGRYKHPGLDCYPWAKETRRQSQQVSEKPRGSSASLFKFLECKVVPEQPLLRIRRTTVTHGALMLYDGER
jgi:trafficking protein particle complex subunit 9